MNEFSVWHSQFQPVKVYNLNVKEIEAHLNNCIDFMVKNNWRNLKTNTINFFNDHELAMNMGENDNGNRYKNTRQEFIH